MKTFEEFMKALETDDALKTKGKEAFEGAEVKNEEAKIATLVRIATENGFNMSVEDFAKRQADCQELDDDELDLIVGGGRGTEEGRCNFDYVCALVWNTCRWSNEYQAGINLCNNSMM